MNRSGSSLPVERDTYTNSGQEYIRHRRSSVSSSTAAGMSSGVSRNRRSGNSNQKGTGTPPGNRREKIRTIKLIFCCGIFLLALGMKYLMPGFSETMRDKALPIISRSIDYEGAISALGQAITGEASISEVLGELYIIAFQIEKKDGEAIGASNENENVDENGVNPEQEDNNLIPSEEPAVSLPPEETGGETAALNMNQTELYEMFSGHNLSSLTGILQTGEGVEPAPETEETSTVVAAFLDSQQQFMHLGIPENTSYEMPKITFSYVKHLVNGWISSGFGYRLHPLDGYVKFHYGLDIAANTGEKISAFADGVVLEAGEDSVRGNYTIIEHKDGFKTEYKHCNSIYVKSGQTVSMSQVIAEAGATGAVTGPHLHFELYHNGQYLNPAYYLSYDLSYS